MFRRLLGASAVAVIQFAGALTAHSADLYYPPSYGSAYDDPRYAEIYRDRPPIPREPVYGRDDRYGGYEHRPQRFAEGGADYCLPRHAIRQRLRDDGWRDMQGVEPRGRVVQLEARRPNGKAFVLTVDRCTGDIVEARPLREVVDVPQYDRYADGPRRWPRGGPWRDWN